MLDVYGNARGISDRMLVIRSLTGKELQGMLEQRIRKLSGLAVQYFSHDVSKKSSEQ